MSSPPWGQEEALVARHRLTPIRMDLVIRQALNLLTIAIAGPMDVMVVTCPEVAIAGKRIRAPRRVVTPTETITTSIARTVARVVLVSLVIVR